MAISRHDLEQWLAGVPDDTTLIAIDDGGLCLLAQGTSAYLEVGGTYNEDEEEEDEDVLCGGCGNWIAPDESSIEFDGEEYHVDCSPEDDA